MPRRTRTYAVRLAVEGGGQVKAELVSVGQSGEQSLRRIETGGEGVVKAKSNTLPAHPIQISAPLIFLDFSGPIQAVPRPFQVFRILL